MCLVCYVKYYQILQYLDSVIYNFSIHFFFLIVEDSSMDSADGEDGEA